MKYFMGNPTMPVLQATYVPPLARLSVEQHRDLARDERRRKPFRQLEARAAHLLGELSLDELEEAVYEFMEKAEELAGHDWRKSSICVLPHVERYRGAVGLDVVDMDGPTKDTRSKISLGCCPAPDIDFVIPADRGAWPAIIEKLAVRIREEIDKEAAGGPVIDIQTRKVIS